MALLTNPWTQPMISVAADRPLQDTLDEMLAFNEAKPVREQLTLIRIFEALRGVGYEDRYDAVRRYARSGRRERAATLADAFVPLSFAPGEVYQFDWSPPWRRSVLAANAPMLHR